MRSLISRFSLLASLFSFLVPRASVLAQYYAYPSFQPPRITLREYNFAFADGRNGGTSLIFQWREGINENMHMQFDVGLADANTPNADARLVLGGGLARRLRVASDELPLDLAITAGVGGSFGGGTSFIRLPVGLSVGHRFAFDAPFFITPYAHPRLSLDACSRCSGGTGRHDTTLGVDVDLGVAAELGHSIELRASVLFSGSDFYGGGTVFGLSLAWTPGSVR